MTTIPVDEATRKVTLAYADRERIAGGFRPLDAELADVPELVDWWYTTHRAHGLLALAGDAVDHPRLGSRDITTSPIVAMEYDPEAGAGWARTWSRWYRLGRTRDPEVKTGLVVTTDHLETAIESFEVDYMPPPPELQPADLPCRGEAWHRLADWFDELHRNGERALLVYLSRRFNWTLSQAYIHTEGFYKTKRRDPDYESYN